MRPRRLWLPVVLASLLLVATPAYAESELRVTFLPVKEGDAALYEGPCGALGLIDVSRYTKNLRLIRTAVAQSGVGRLEWVAVSHYDQDHLGNILPVLKEFHPRAVYDRGGDASEKDTKSYKAYVRWFRESKEQQRRPLKIGDSFALCSGPEKVTFTVISVGTDGTAAGGVVVKQENDKGLCLKVTYADFDLATCGDISGGVKASGASKLSSLADPNGSITCFLVNALKRSGANVESAVASVLGDVEFAKVNHHGSPSSSNPYYVSTVRAQASIVVGATQRYNHPNCGVVQRWKKQGTVYLTTNSDGTARDGWVVVASSGHERFTVTTTGSHRMDTYPIDELAPLTYEADGGGMSTQDWRLVIGIGIGAFLVLLGGWAGQLLVAWSHRRDREEMERASRGERWQSNIDTMRETLGLLSAIARGEGRAQIDRWPTVREPLLAIQVNHPSQDARRLAERLIGEMDRIGVSLSEQEPGGTASNANPEAVRRAEQTTLELIEATLRL